LSPYYLTNTALTRRLWRVAVERQSVDRVECSETRHFSLLFIIPANIPAYSRRVSQKAFYPTYPANDEFTRREAFAWNDKLD